MWYFPAHSSVNFISLTAALVVKSATCFSCHSNMLVLEHPTVNYISWNAELVTQGVTCFSYQSDASVIECLLASLRKEEENGVDGVIILFMYVVESFCFTIKLITCRLCQVQQIDSLGLTRPYL